MTNITNCNQCSRQCPIDDLRCGSGRRYMEGLRAESKHEHGRHGHGCGRHGERHGSGRELEERERGRCHKRGHHGREEYDSPEDLLGMLRACGHILYHQAGKQSGQGRILHILSERGELSQKELQEMLRVQPGSMSEILSKMENKGFVERIRDEEDKRKTQVRLTGAGKAHVQEHHSGMGNKDIFSALDENQQEELKELLTLLLEDWKHNI